MMRLTSWSRRIEIALWFTGAMLLGVASGGTLARWTYQTQERALFDRGPASVASAARSGPAPPAGPAAARNVPAVSAEHHPEAARTTPATDVRLTTKAASKPKIAAALASHAIARIEIPRLGVDAIVDDGADETTLARAVGLVPGSAHPGQVGNTVLAAHRDTFFRPLQDIQVNDRIRLVVPPHTYEYRVQSLRVVSPEETNVLQSKGVEELTLVTCYPFRFIGPAPDRFIVSATRVD